MLSRYLKTKGEASRAFITGMGDNPTASGEPRAVRPGIARSLDQSTILPESTGWSGLDQW